MSYNMSDAKIAEKLALIEFQHIFSFMVPIIYGITVPVGCLGNLFVIITVCSQRQRQNTTDILFVNLAIVDFLFIMVYVPFIVTTRVIGSWVFVCVRND